MKVINTPEGLIEWLVIAVKSDAKPKVFAPKALVDQFDEMIKAFVQTGWWQFAGTEDEFFGQLNDRIDRDAMGARCSKAVPEFVATMVGLSGEDRAVGGIGVPCIAAVIQLLLSVPKNNKVIFSEGGEYGVRARSKMGFERHHGVSIDVLFSLDDRHVLH
ncbi:hypothetical protein MesoLj131b_01260 [Mesorhizobium sp. 131-2-5]|uniref:hypothetical protein n=1 Tax=Mesorhizobium sp. 131-2-5 TaxID=2744519 RepID=UPI0019266D35|nr:hypothetical protein [Mesorhizobium sp. 131-2-5]BCG98126.1 hypothetical protein MesoLj131b_01260 [Mesorhizobium sp. 131-2-5]